ncbi:MAG: c-type cytochrome domain-containing protein [Planctomycetaceae bacterium]
MSRACLWLLLAVSVLHSPAVADDAGDAELAVKAYEILKTRCYRCHGGSARQAGVDVLSRDILLEERGEIGAKFAFIVPGDVAKSQLLETLEGGADSYMPKEGSPEAKGMTDEEKELLRKWVSAGAVFPKLREFDFISETQILNAMRDYLLTSKADNRQNIRFFTLTHLHNNPTVSELDLRLYRAALAKAINSLTKERDIVMPAALKGTGDSVYAIDLSDLGWHRGQLWQEILGHYPYALKYDFVKDEELKQVWKDVAQFSGADVPYLRADWFIVTATRPPLYHQLLDVPDTLMGLEHQLQFDIKQNFLRGDVARSGYAKSGVSKQNRLLERHTTTVTPYLWISYDFLPKRAKGDLARFPLGPKFPGNPYNNQAFEHDGGEVIWSLPNGMQGYMLVKDNGDRIDQGPIEVVFDRSAVLGTPAIINGISCMYCHRDGMITDFRDELRNADALGGIAREHLLDIYPPHEQMQKLTRQDQEIFMRSLQRITGPFLQVGEDREKPISSFPEPIGKVAEMYSRDLTRQELALELGFENIELLQAKIEANRELLRFGLGTMVQAPPGTLKREKWETQDGTSLMQDVASQLRLGLPYIPPTPRGQ